MDKPIAPKKPTRGGVVEPLMGSNGYTVDFDCITVEELLLWLKRDYPQYHYSELKLDIDNESGNLHILAPTEVYSDVEFDEKLKQYEIDCEVYAINRLDYKIHQGNERIARLKRDIEYQEELNQKSKHLRKEYDEKIG